MMRHLRRLRLIPLALSLIITVTSLTCLPVQAQDAMGALERGYRTGYSDGYMAGYRDNADRAPRDFRDEEDYRRADRAYAQSYGALEDYRDGYQQGFEVGYASGYERRGFDSNIPAGLGRRGVDNSEAETNGNVSNGGTTSGTTSGTGRVSTRNEITIPSNTVFVIELLDNLSTEATQEGDKFRARVLGPAEYEGAVIDGRVTRVKRPGKVKGTAELQLTFDEIQLDNRFGNIRAQVIEVIPMGNGESTGGVDSEGGVKGKDSTKGDVTKIGAATGIGAIIGAIAGGGKGAAIGAAIGGAVGTGGVLSTRGKEIRLPRGQQLRIRTDSETRMQ
ncbi:MAG: hypothetical protein JO360_12680 [Acidobacteria bacterium]|nr:hypothetical protein [Acidobacteriota bacterium]